MIAMLNTLFDAQAQAIATHGGEILKFIGDGLLAIFPIEHADKAAAAARSMRRCRQSRPRAGLCTIHHL
jgi:adenylate cyclase